MIKMLLIILMIIRMMMILMMIYLFILPTSSLPSRSFEAALCLPSFATFLPSTSVDDDDEAYDSNYHFCC